MTDNPDAGFLSLRPKPVTRQELEAIRPSGTRSQAVSHRNLKDSSKKWRKTKKRPLEGPGPTGLALPCVLFEMK